MLPVHTEFPGGHAEPFFEFPVKIGQVFKAGFRRYGQDRTLGGQKQPGGHGKPVVV